MNQKKLIHIAIVVAALIAFVRFRDNIAELVGKVPGLNKLANVPPGFTAPRG